jgi:hypothetical protein
MEMQRAAGATYPRRSTVTTCNDASGRRGGILARKAGIMTVTERVLEQGKALVRGIEALETIGDDGPIERVQAWFLIQAHKRRLRAIVGSVPAWVAEEILSASERVGSERPAVLMGESEWGNALLSIKAARR